MKLALEHSEQREAVKWFREQYPEHVMALKASPMGVHRGRGAKAGRATSNIKGLGGVTGEADLSICIPRNGYGSMMIEHKGEGQPHTLSQAQIDNMNYHNSIGNLAVSTRGIEAIKAAIKAYMG